MWTSPATAPADGVTPYLSRARPDLSATDVPAFGIERG